jgi:hypothetical protein
MQRSTRRDPSIGGVWSRPTKAGCSLHKCWYSLQTVGSLDSNLSASGEEEKHRDLKPVATGMMLRAL